MCMFSLHVCMYNTRGIRVYQEGAAYLGTRGLYGREPLCGGWELGPLQEQQVILTARLSLQLLCRISKMKTNKQTRT